jgi:serine phosphatase RsbU (regulator of sigma subunit)
MPDVHLEVHDALGRRVVTIDKPSFVIGRRSGSDVHVMDTEVSREHAEIVQAGGRYLVRDRGSRFGTFVNGSQVTEQSLAHGDRIRLGKSGKAELLFWVGDLPPDGGTSSGGSSIIGGFRQVAKVLETLQAVGGARLLDEVLTLVMDTAIEITEAERGFIMLANEKGELELKLARAAGKVPLPAGGFERSRKIPESVYASGLARVVSDLQDGDLKGAHEGTIALGIRHVLCVPLRLVRYMEVPGIAQAAQIIGVLYLDSREKGKILSHTAKAALETLAAEAAGAIENTRLYREALEKARIDEELKIASQIQQALLPRPKKSGPYFEAYGTSIACRAIGGDFFDYIDYPDGRFAFALGDVAGKGPPAALLTAVIQGLLLAHAASAADARETIVNVNRGLHARAIAARFATAFFGILDGEGRLTYCNAGHNAPMLFSNGSARRLEAGGLVLGLFEDVVYDQGVVQLSAGDVVVLFSDGVCEAVNEDGEEFGDERITEAVLPALDQGPQATLEALLASVRRFAQGAPMKDDITAVVVHYTPPAFKNAGRGVF